MQPKVPDSKAPDQDAIRVRHQARRGGQAHALQGL